MRIGNDAFVEIDRAAATSGAGIAALPPDVNAPAPDVYLLAPRGTVDAGDAGIRVAGDLFIAAQAVANADNIKVQGQAFGLPPTPVTNLTLTTASTAATEAASLVRNIANRQPSLQVSVEVTGFGGEPDKPTECVPTASQGCQAN